MTSFSIGCDPEFYLTLNKKPVSAHDIVPGTKKEPHPLKCGGAVQRDGVAVEFNIPPSKTAEEFADNVGAALTELRGMIPREYTFNFKPYVSFDPVYFKSLPPPVKELGCDPDYSAYRNGDMQPSPSIHADLPNRCFGGHIHIGWGENLGGPGHMEDCCAFIQNLSSVQPYPYYSSMYELSTMRRSIYGNVGSFRPKPYGVEWRSPDNTWLAAEPNTWKFMFNQIKKTFDIMTTGVKKFYDVRPASVPKFTM